MEQHNIESERMIVEPASRADFYIVWGRYQPGMRYVVIGSRDLLTEDEATARARKASLNGWREVYIGRIPGTLTERT